MPRPLFKKPEMQTKEDSLLSAKYKPKNTTSTKLQDKMMVDRLLRKPRSKAYMEAMTKLDAGGHVHNQHKVNGIIDAIKSEFPEVSLEGILLGVVSICYLGEPYEVHTLDMSGGIIRHYKDNEVLPGKLESARSIALRGGYEFIEVYVDCLRCVSSNGAVSVVTC